MTNMDSASAARNIADQAADRVGPTIAVAVHIRQQDEIIAGLRREISTAQRKVDRVVAELDDLETRAATFAHPTTVRAICRRVRNAII